MSHYPKVKIDLHKLEENLANVKALCEKNHIKIAGVIKGCNGITSCSKVFADGGVEYIASSRISQLIDAKNANIKTPLMLIRIPMSTEVEDVIQYTDVSLNSQIEIIRLLNEEAKKQNKIHNIILMDDLGDLREGIWEEDQLIDVSKEIEFEMSNIHLLGIGTNLGCYGGIVTTEDKMEELVRDAKIIEEAIGRKLKYISGGTTMALPLLFKGQMPEEINLLRIGEAILLGRDLMEIWPKWCGKINQDVFTLEMEVIEDQIKPSYPVGIIEKDGFGLTKQFEDKGMRRRLILGGGKVDYGYPKMLISSDENIEVIGASSDHTIVDVNDSKKDIKVGDILEFQLSYANLVYITSSKDVEITTI